MLPYLLLLLVSTVFPLLVYQHGSLIYGDDYSYIVRKRNKMTFVLFFLGLFVLLALRDITVGTDLRTYKVIFETCFDSAFESLSDLQWELGYTVYNKIVAMVSTNYRFFLILTAVFVLIPVYKLYSKETKFSFLAIVLFINMPCFLMIFSGLRQAMAISIGVLAYMAVENRRYILSILLVILAIAFHVSAFVLFLIYPAFLFRIKTKHLLYIVPVLIAIYLFRVPMLNFLIGFLPTHYVTFYGEVRQTGALGMMLLFLVFFVFSFTILDENAMSKRDYFMRNVLLISTVFQFFVPIHGLIQRASYYFLIFVPISIISVVQAPKKWLKNVSDAAIIVMGCFFALYFFYNGLFSTDNLLDVFPYKFFWSGEVW
ncbi:MAG: EpsG family protein [Clostridia bacterium]|nr:EpsG family protein [Clostridia bacterium]